MSRLAKKPIAIPSGVTIAIHDGVLTVRGSNGELSRPTPRDVEITVGYFFRRRPPSCDGGISFCDAMQFVIEASTAQHLLQCA